MAKHDRGDYEVGYSRPPEHTRFKPGQSGNPKGRPNGARNLKSDLIDELTERIVIREGDRTRTVTKQRAMVKTVMTRALKGDARATSQVFEMVMRLLDRDDAAGEAAAPPTDDELEIIKAYERRLRRGEGGTATPSEMHAEPKP